MNLLASLFFGIGVGGWVYTQVARRSGNANPGSTAIVAGLTALTAFIFFFTLLTYVLHFN